MNVLLINLHNKPERLISTIHELHKVDLSAIITRIEAVDHINASKKQIISETAYNNIQNVENTLIMPNYSAVGCAISHRKCWKYIIDNNINECIIVEDDIEITDEKLFDIDMNYLSHKINNTPTPLFISFNSKLNNEKQNRTKIEHICDIFTGTQFYYINKTMATYLYDNTKILTYQIDITIGLLSRLNSVKYNFYNINTTSVIQTNKFLTDIQTYIVSINDLSNTNLPLVLLRIIYNYIPNIFKISNIDNMKEHVYSYDMLNNMYYMLNS